MREIGDSQRLSELRGLRESFIAGVLNLSDGWVDLTDSGEAILKEVHIGHYSQGNLMNHAEKEIVDYFFIRKNINYSELLMKKVLVSYLPEGIFLLTMDQNSNCQVYVQEVR